MDISADATLAATLQASAGSTGPAAGGVGAIGRGEAIGRYMVIAKVGAGGMGVVFAAYDPELDRKVALKLLRFDAADLSHSHERLQREAQALAKLDHPNVVAVYDVGIHAGQLFVAMEFIEGQTLGAWLASAEPSSSSGSVRSSSSSSGRGGLERGPRPALRPWREVVEVFAAAGRGLAAAHEAGMVHRDFKPDNVMLGADGRVRVMDFGLARAEQRESQGPAEGSAQRGTLDSMTRTGAMMGTPGYMSLEQFEGRKVDARSDQFSFCVALYEALYGERPFAADSVAALVFALSVGDIREPPRKTKVPSWVRAVVVRGLAKEPAERHESMRALLDALADDPVARRRRRGAWTGLAAGLVAGAWALSRMSGEVAERDAVIEEQASELEQTNAALKRELAAQTRLLSIQRGIRASSLIPEVREREALSLAVAAVGAYADDWERAPLEAIVGLEQVLAHDVQVVINEQLTRHSDYVSQVVYSPDGSQVASASFDGTARLWDPASGQTLAELEGHEGPIYNLRFRPDGSSLATAGADGTARLWALDGTPLARLEGHTDEIIELAYSPDGSRLATASADGTARIWDADSGAPVAVLAGHSKPIRRLAYAPDGETLATASYDGSARVWDASSGAPRLRLGERDADLRALAYAPDGSRLASAGTDGVVDVWDAASGELVARFEGHTRPVSSLEFSPDGGHLLTGSFDGTAAIFAAESGERLASLAGQHYHGMAFASYGPDGARIVTGSFEGTAAMWDAASHEPRARFVGHKGDVWAIAWAPDGKHMVTGSADGTARVWDFGEQVVAQEGPERDVFRFAHAPDGSGLATVDQAGRLRVWDADSGALLATLATLDLTGIVEIYYSRDGRRLIAQAGNRARIWDAQTHARVAEYDGYLVHAPDSRTLAVYVDGQVFVHDADSGARLSAVDGLVGTVRWSFAPDGGRLLVARGAEVWAWTRGADRFEPAFRAARDQSVRMFSHAPDGRELAVLLDDNTLEFWDSARDQWRRSLEIDAAVVEIGYSPKGTYFFVACKLIGVRVWRASSAELVAHYQNDDHDAEVRTVVFDPDERRLATLEGRRVSLRDPKTGEVSTTLEGHELPVMRVAFSFDGARVTTYSKDSLRVWDAETGELLTRERIGLADPQGSVSWPLHPRELTRIGCERLQVFSHVDPEVRAICERVLGG